MTPRGETETSPRDNTTTTRGQDLTPKESTLPPVATVTVPKPTTFVAKGTSNTTNPNLPPPAMITAVVKPIPEFGQAKPKLMPESSTTLPTLVGAQPNF